MSRNLLEMQNLISWAGSTELERPNFSQDTPPHPLPGGFICTQADPGEIEDLVPDHSNKVIIGIK